MCAARCDGVGARALRGASVRAGATAGLRGSVLEQRHPRGAKSGWGVVAGVYPLSQSPRDVTRSLGSVLDTQNARTGGTSAMTHADACVIAASISRHTEGHGRKNPARGRLGAQLLLQA